MKKLLFPLLMILVLCFWGCSSNDDDGGGGGGNTTTIVRLIADTTVTAPNMTSVNETPWTQVTAVDIPIGYKSDLYGMNPTISKQNVSAKAIVKNDKLYLWFKWHDPSPNIKADYFKVADTNPVVRWDNYYTSGQDVFSMIMDAGNNGTEMADCATMCHATTMRTTGGGIADAWTWKSGSLFFAKMAEDMRVNAVSTEDDSRGAATINDYPYRVNWQAIDSLRPMYMNPDTFDYHNLYLDYSNILTLNNFLDWPLGYEMPGYVIDFSIFGAANRTESSMNDVRAIAEYDSTGADANQYTWTVVFERALNTTHTTDDAIISGLDSVQATIAVTHNDNRKAVVEHSGSEPFWIILK